ncbi:MAG: surface lipoprotein assembly modifier [Desulfobacterales bacterium]
MKRVLISIVTVLFLLSIFSSASADSGRLGSSSRDSKRLTFPSRGKLVGSGVNLRSGPSLTADVVDRISEKDRSIDITGQQDDWYQVRTENGYAWINRAYVILDVAAARPTEKNAKPSRENGRATVSDADREGEADSYRESSNGATSAEAPFSSAAEERPPEEPGRAYYDFGVFAYEDGDYEDAESNFTKALSFDVDNAFYNHFLGKTYQKMKRHAEAMRHLARAWEIDPAMLGLRYDLAFQHYQMANYETAADLFMQTVAEEPGNVLAHYYAGTCLFKQKRYETALGYFLTAADKSSSIRANGLYYAGICYRKMEKIKEAIDQFTYVKYVAGSPALKSNAAKWLGEIEARRKRLKPLRLYAKIGYAYDDNVRLEPLDQDIFADEDDANITAYLSGRYDFVNRDNIKLGIGYNHFQTIHNRLEAYDLVGSISDIHFNYKIRGVTLGFSYLPSFFWLDTVSYMRRQQFKPDISVRIGKRISTRLSYSYMEIDHVQDNGRDGHIDEITADGFYTYTGKVMLFGGAAYEKSQTTHPNQEYAQSKLKLGLAATLPRALKLNVTAKYNHKQYDNMDTLLNAIRRDTKYSGALSLSTRFLSDGCSLVLDFSYTSNDSNIIAYSYERLVATLSLAATY